MKEISTKKLKEVMSYLGKQSVKKNPKTKEQYSEMGKKGMKKRWGKDVDNSVDTYRP